MIKKIFELFFTISPVYSYKISGQSMAPTLLEGDMVLVNRSAYWLRKPVVNDIIAAKDPRDGKVLIKRIIRSDGLKYFIQGDNKNHSTDSRVFGMIGRENVVGKVVFRKREKSVTT